MNEQEIMAIRTRGVPSSNTPGLYRQDLIDNPNVSDDDYAWLQVKFYESSSNPYQDNNFVEWASNTNNINKYIRSSWNTSTQNNVRFPVIQGKNGIEYDCSQLTTDSCISNFNTCSKYHSPGD